MQKSKTCILIQNNRQWQSLEILLACQDSSPTQESMCTFKSLNSHFRNTDPLSYLIYGRVYFVFLMQVKWIKVTRRSMVTQSSWLFGITINKIEIERITSISTSTTIENGSTSVNFPTKKWKFQMQTENSCRTNSICRGLRSSFRWSEIVVLFVPCFDSDCFSSSRQSHDLT